MQVLRGIGILLVVLGHSFPGVDSESGNVYGIIHRFIYSFHMPLFFFISGFFAIKLLKMKTLKENANFMKQKAMRLLVPYLLVSLLGLPIKLIFDRFSERPAGGMDAILNIILYPTNNAVIALWFLYTLFLVFLVMLLVLRINTYFLLPSLIILNVFAGFFPEIFNLSGVAQYCFYFYIGLLFRKRYQEFIGKINLYIGLFVGLVCLSFASVYQINMPIVNLFISILGIMMSVSLAYLVGGRWGKWLEMFGNYSMGIYLFSWFPQVAIRIVLLQILNLPYMFVVLTIFIGGLTPVILEYLILSKKTILFVLFLGKKSFLVLDQNDKTMAKFAK
ncbi:acyltransferase family protein [Listeria fleischmannii]|uniref:acyltransferase family protein n=1 Tax=Listeria fleischmannii TaxID=1069827 RepID=UPI00240A6B6E|nr:acyltransferase [Listeria fleischmannii]